MQAAQKLPRRAPIPHLSVVPSLLPPRPVPRPKAKPLVAVPAIWAEQRAEDVEELSAGDLDLDLDLEDDADTEVAGMVPSESAPVDEVKSQSILVVRRTTPKICAAAVALVTLRLLILAGRALARRYGATSSFLRSEWTRALGDVQAAAQRPE
jgi:hypothetical protein